MSKENGKIILTFLNGGIQIEGSHISNADIARGIAALCSSLKEHKVPKHAILAAVLLGLEDGAIETTKPIGDGVSISSELAELLEDKK